MIAMRSAARLVYIIMLHIEQGKMRAITSESHPIHNRGLFLGEKAFFPSDILVALTFETLPINAPYFNFDGLFK